MGYEQVNQVYADAHIAGTLTDADYVEWIAQIRNHQQHHADGRLEEVEYKHALRASHAFIDKMSYLTDAQRERLRDEIRQISL